MSELLQPIAIVRFGDNVALFFDTDAGWGAYDVLCGMLRPYLLQSLTTLLEHPFPPEVGITEQDFLIVPLAATGLPGDLPEGKVVACHPSLCTPDVPVFTPASEHTEDFALWEAELSA